MGRKAAGLKPVHTGHGGWVAEEEVRTSLGVLTYLFLRQLEKSFLFLFCLPMSPAVSHE